MDRLDVPRQIVMEAINPIGSEGVPLGASGGRYLARAALARRAAPPHTCSAMDGYAVRHAGLRPGEGLTLGPSVYAGDAPGPAIGAREAARIFTGAPLPGGADTVVREESAEVRDGQVFFRQAPEAGENVRRAGEDVAEGGEALPAGTRVGARQLALLEAVGCVEVEVRRRARVALVATGDEIVLGRTPDSNGAALAGLLAAAGLDVVRTAVPDDLGAVRVALASALSGADALVTIGGVSVGERDHVAAALAALGADVRVHGVAMKPGKPFLFAVAGDKPVFGLPGSPSACLVAFEVFARPALLRLAGAGRTRRTTVRLPLAGPVAGRAGRARFVWATVDGAGRAVALGRDAAQVRGPALATALLAVPADAGDLPAGAEVEAWLLDD